ncbi:MAG: DUF488 domain-containing protein [Acidobacteria bacterium]|nr:DUF488 domain-containing protein [Acidobacteriota bacterium]
MKLFTLGYQGLSLEAYALILQEAGAGVVLDVRERAWSYRPQYVKSPFRDGLASYGLDYVHLNVAGNPSAIRKTVNSTEECMLRYSEYLALHPEVVEELYSHVRAAAERGRPACLTCYEHLTADCHRSVLVNYLLEAYPAVEPVHLPLAVPETEDPLPAKRRKSGRIAPSLLPVPLPA